MNVNSALGRRARRPTISTRLLLAAAAAALIIAAIAVLLASHRGGASLASQSSERISTTSPAHFQSLVKTHLNRLGLNYRWVACVPSGRSFHGTRIVRCNVDFGEPHIMAYCSVLRGGQLLTSQEDPAIPCGHDDSGMYTPVVTYN